MIRIAEDHVGFSGHTTGLPGTPTPVTPVQPLFDITDELSIAANLTEFSLEDVTLYVSTTGRLFTSDPFAGGLETDVGPLRTGGNDGVLDIAMRSDGRLFGTDAQLGGNVQNNAGQLVEINPAAGGAADVGDIGIPDFNAGTNPPDPNQLTTNTVDALAYLRTGFDGNANTPIYQLFYSARGTRVLGGQSSLGSTLYRADPNTGNTPVANTPFQVIGGIFDNVAGDVGRTTGMAFVGGQLFGVSDTGNFYIIGGGGGGGGLASNVVNLGFAFAGLAPGPQNVEGGAYANIMFAVDTAGNLHAIDTSGQLQPIFAGGATSVNIGVTNPTGLAFSPLDANLWHPTMMRSDDPGHGVNAAFDQSRNTIWLRGITGGLSTRATSEREGGASWRFGLDTWVNNPVDSYFTYSGNAQLGFSPEAHRDLSSNPLINNTYNTPGGAYGSIVTLPFSLPNSVAQDKPTVYFNYFLDSENINSLTTMRDSFRVHISADGGGTWQLLATNNSILSNSATFAELPRYISVSENASNQPNQRVQEAFDNSGGWRQARVDLSEFAGLPNLQIRFDFSSAGTMNEGLDGDFNGDFFHPRRGQNNQFEGVYIDDVIIGYAERGEMATGSQSQNNFFAVPVNPDFGAPSEVLVGPYQLELRRGTEYGINPSGVVSDIIVPQQFHTNTRFIPSLLRLGDQNLTREQGHIEIDSNTIRFASGFGILVDASARDAVGDVPHPGAVRNLPTLNNRRLIPAVSVENNVVFGLGTGGIRFSGETSPAGQPVAGVPYGEIVNNTVYGGVSPQSQGIVVDHNANPTILNNIVANTATGISIDASSGLSEVGANLFRGNLNNGVIGDNPIPPIGVPPLPANFPLFVDEANGNFYLFAGSQAIDSSLNTLQEDPSLTVVKSPLGIPTAPIFAPNLDRFGQLRIDDPAAQPPPGLGSNIFKDRGAIERTDFARPVGRITDPLDNDPANRDRSPAPNDVLIRNETLTIFVLKLLDAGIGIDDLSVTAGKFILSQDGVPLVLGTDYTFVYNSTNDEVYFTPISGAWPLNHTYSILVDNTATGIRDLAGNLLEPNRTDGTTLFTIFVGTVRDFGDAPSPYPSLLAANGAAHDVVLGYHLGAGVDEEQEARIAGGDSFDDGVTNILFSPGNASSFTVNASAAGFLDAWVDLNRDGDWADAGENIVSARPLVAGTETIVVSLPGTASLGQSWARFRFSSAGISSPVGVAADGEVEDYQVNLAGPPFHNGARPEDVDNDGDRDTIDLLVVLNTLTFLTGQLVVFAPSAPLPVTIPPYKPGTPNIDPTGGGVPGRGLFVDVVPDAFGNFGSVDTLDLLAVLNWLSDPGNFDPDGEGEGGSATSFAMATGPSASAPTASGAGSGSTSAASKSPNAALLATEPFYASPSIVMEERSTGSALDDTSWLQGGADDALDLVAAASPTDSDAVGRALSIDGHARRQSPMGPLDEDAWDHLLTDLSLDVGGLPGDLEDLS